MTQQSSSLRQPDLYQVKTATNWFTLRISRSVALAATILLFATADLASATDATDKQSLQLGQRLLEQYCAACHAIGTEGSSSHEQAPAFRDLSQKYPVALLDEALAEGIMSGHPDMPVYEFEPDQIEGIIEYLESIQTTR